MGMITRRLRTHPVVRSAAKLCRKYLQWYDNPGYHFQRNGEQWLIERFRHEPVRTVIDVGANVGEWSRLAAAQLPGATIYALEIVPATFDELRQATRSLPAIRCVDHGLADHAGSLDIRYNPAFGSHATFTEYPVPGQVTVIRGRVMTGDAFLEQRGLSTVDILKIDVEGAEHLVVQGFQRAFADRRIRLAYFEYGRCNLVTRFFLKDFYDLFERSGYVVGKLFTDFVDFRAYRLEDEDFVGPHYVVCRRDEPLIDRLRGL